LLIRFSASLTQSNLLDKQIDLQYLDLDTIFMCIFETSKVLHLLRSSSLTDSQSLLAWQQNISNALQCETDCLQTLINELLHIKWHVFPLSVHVCAKHASILKHCKLIVNTSTLSFVHAYRKDLAFWLEIPGCSWCVCNL